MARFAPIVFALGLAVPLTPALGQLPGPRPPEVPASARSRVRIGPATVPPITLLIGPPAGRSLTERLGLDQAPASHRGRNALIGGLIGGAVGIVTCTVISNISKDPGTGFSTCTAKGYLGLGLGGAALGALIGALL